MSLCMYKKIEENLSSILSIVIGPVIHQENIYVAIISMDNSSDLKVSNIKFNQTFPCLKC